MESSPETSESVYLWDTLPSKAKFFLLNQVKVREIEEKTSGWKFEWKEMSDSVKKILLSEKDRGLEWLTNMTLFDWGLVDSNHRIANLTILSLIRIDSLSSLNSAFVKLKPLSLDLQMDKSALDAYVNDLSGGNGGFFSFIKSKPSYETIWIPMEHYIESFIDLGRLNAKDKVDVGLVGVKALASYASRYYFNV